MNYKETIEYLYNSTPVFEQTGAKAYKAGLDNSIELDNHFHNPHKKFKTIHIAGTNGKGSCSHSIAAILQNEGYKVGLFTSPHLTDFKERIRVNGQCINEQYVIDFVRNEHQFFETLNPSFFELTTALAFKYFADKNVDIAVIEVGLGGRMDCTNIITPILSIITNISFDHMQFLGNTLSLIAKEKAGIIKQNIPVVIGESNSETRTVFEETAHKVHAPILFAEDEENREVINAELCTHGGIKYKCKHFGMIHGDLSGIYQTKNMNTVLCSVHVLMEIGVLKREQSIVNALKDVCKTTGLRGRWETIQRSPMVICDTGHNVAGWNYIVKQLSFIHCKQLRIVFGMVDDKDIDEVMNILPHNAKYYFTQASTKRAFPVETVFRKGVLHGLSGTMFSTVAEAYVSALSDCSSDDCIYVGGSTYVVSDFLSYIESYKNAI